jgi:hypothetical protein
MKGFIYIWRDKIRNMYYIGSHDGLPDDGYISSSHWLTAEVRYRPSDFRRKILKFIDLSNMKIEEYRILSMIKEKEFGKKYYNLKSGRKIGSIPWNKGTKGAYSEEYRAKIAASRKGKPTTKGKSNPAAAENGRKGAVTLAAKAKGRTRLYKEDGSWTWQYPK